MCGGLTEVSHTDGTILSLLMIDSHEPMTLFFAMERLVKNGLPSHHSSYKATNSKNRGGPEAEKRSVF